MLKFSKPKYKVDGLIGSNTTFRGEVTFTGGMRIEGDIFGNITSTDPESVVVIAEGATIEGDITAAYVVINGTVTGNVYSQKLLELEEKGRIVGDMTYEMVQMHSGAVVSGRLLHKKAEPDVFAA